MCSWNTWTKHTDVLIDLYHSPPAHWPKETPCFRWPWSKCDIRANTEGIQPAAQQEGNSPHTSAAGDVRALKEARAKVVVQLGKCPGVFLCSTHPFIIHGPNRYFMPSRQWEIAVRGMLLSFIFSRVIQIKGLHQCFARVSDVVWILSRSADEKACTDGCRVELEELGHGLQGPTKRTMLTSFR